MEDDVGASNPPPTNAEVHDLSEGGTEIEISSEPVFGLDDENNDEVQQPFPSNDFIMVLDDEESNRSHHSTSNPKHEKKKNLVVSRKEFLDLQSKVDQILATVTSATLRTIEDSIQQSLVNKSQALETREKFSADKMLLRLEMHNRQLDNQRTVDHQEFISKATYLIDEVWI